MDAWPKWLGAVVLSIALLIASPCWALYWYGNAVLPTKLEPSTRRYSDEIRTLYWKSEGGRGAIQIRRLNPVTMVWRTLEPLRSPRSRSGQELNQDADLRVARPAAWYLMLDMPRQTGLRRHAADFAMAIRITREWTATQIIDTSLERSFFGRNIRGLDAAARFYFGTPHEELSQPEQLGLLVLTRSPSGLDPVCKPKRFAERYALLAKRIGMVPPTVDAARRRLIAHPCGP